MKKVHISYGNDVYTKSLDLLEQTSLEIGKVDQFIKYNPEAIKDSNFWRKNQFILSRPRGAGYWIWKPHIILETFKELENGDCVLYSDAGLKVIGNLNPLFDVMRDNPNGGKIIFRLPWVGAQHITKNWTKRDCFVLMNSDEAKYWNAPMTNGAISLWEKNDKNIEFLNQWQRYLRDPRIVTDSSNFGGKPNFMEFKDHRHDQSVLSILCTTYDYELFRDPTQWGNVDPVVFTNSPYPQLFHHHRNFKH